ncbi:hypothetical protein [Azohydromonas sediminis]|uniref:hypothetical protein n=1 Tax=Azohydromonas sediminis TaxID=2259674 RepID=UPI000E64BDB8|nr:hypothetical protein [Azohydromonas sediminis]
MTAERLGLIQRDANVRWVDVNSTPAPLEQQHAKQQGTNEVTQQDPAQDPGSVLFDREDLEAWAEDIAPLPQPSYDAAVAGAINVALGKTDPEAVSKALAKATGMEPELALQYVQECFTMYHRAAVKATGMADEAAEKVFERAQQATPTRLHEAIQRLVYAQAGRLFGELARDFRVANPPDLSAFREQGFQTAIDRETGEVLLQKNGGTWRRLSGLGL